MSGLLDSVEDVVANVAEGVKDVAVYTAQTVEGIPSFVGRIPGNLKAAYEEVSHPAQFAKDIQEKFKSIPPRIIDYGKGLQTRIIDGINDIKENTLNFSEAVGSRINGYPEESFYQSVSNAVDDSDEFKRLNFLQKTAAFFVAFPKNIPKSTYDILEYVRRFSISGETLYVVMKVVSVILLAFQFYLVYTTYQMTALISSIPAFENVSNSNSYLSYIATISCLFYLLIFLYLLRSSYDNYNTEIVRYFFNVNLILVIMMSTFLDKILVYLGTLNYNTVQDSTTIPQAISIQATQSSIFSQITTITVIAWIYTNLISVICDVSEWGLEVAAIF